MDGIECTDTFAAVKKEVEMDKEAMRRQSQLDFVASGEEIRIGDASHLPLPIETLQATTPESDYVLEAHTGGLTAHVFRIGVDGKEWNLKVKRPESLVRNVDGQTSFLNEVQRRRDFQAFKDEPKTADAFKHVVKTEYASFRQGIMLSPWIQGELLDTFNEQVLTQIFSTIVNFELHGIMEWDLCPGNILFDGKQITLFDFGYCYEFDPLTEFNSCGLNAPLFHSVERLETRNFFGFLLNREDAWSHDAILDLFELEKHLALEAFQYKYSVLKQRGASETVMTWLEQIIRRWQTALSSRAALEDLFLVEGYRSHLLDVHDDVGGQSCTKMTLKRIAKLHDTVNQHYDVLKSLDGFFFGDENKTQAELLREFEGYKQKAIKYQL